MTQQPSGDLTGTPAAAAGAAPVGKVAVPLAKALATAGELYLAGRIREAEIVCRQILERRPNLADAYNLLGVILNAKGDPKAAVNTIGRAIKLNPRAPSFYANLGEIERQRGKLVEAEIALNKAIELDPKAAQAYSNLGIVHFDRKDFDKAAANYEKAIALQPNFPEAHNNLGNAYRALERKTEALACYQRAVTQRPNYAEAYNNMATSLRDAEDYESAEHAYRKAITLRPNYVEAHNNLSILLLYRDRTDEALRVLADALKLDERNAATLLNVAKVQLKRAAHGVAEQAVRFALQVDPKKAEAYMVLAQIHHELDQHPEALAALEKAIALDPEVGEFHSFYGVVLKSVGRLDEARAEIRKALEFNPDLYGAYANLNDLETFEADHDLMIQMKDILERADKPNSDRYLPIHFAYAKALEDVGEYKQALEHYAIGAKLRRNQLQYDEAETFSFFDQIKATFSKDTFANRRWGGDPSKTPVFILGMPRSGSTLVEQILSSHPQTFGAGEVKVLHRALGALRDRLPSIPKYPAMINAMDPEHFQQIASDYLAELQRESDGAARVTDKLLTNYFFVGLIQLLFPNAKIIHTRRNPVDTCLSAYTKLFKDDMPHSYDLGELGRYYRRYEDLMAFWAEVLPPGVMMTVDYESVVGDLETNARALIEHIGLPWDDACVNFHESRRPVKTASVVQVRQPVYKTSVERWKRYGDGLAPLLEALDYQQAAKPAPKAKRKGA
ncbi:MAG: tetratricopeptide repeat protein [Caulobacteraceae bacterium]|nr:tetratricopeptide repeat protein [Caulobacteraceae bacterium]